MYTNYQMYGQIILYSYVIVMICTICCTVLAVCNEDKNIGLLTHSTYFFGQIVCINLFNCIYVHNIWYILVNICDLQVAIDGQLFTNLVKTFPSAISWTIKLAFQPTSSFEESNNISPQNFDFRAPKKFLIKFPFLLYRIVELAFTKILNPFVVFYLIWLYIYYETYGFQLVAICCPLEILHLLW